MRTIEYDLPISGFRGLMTKRECFFCDTSEEMQLSFLIDEKYKEMTLVCIFDNDEKRTIIDGKVNFPVRLVKSGKVYMNVVAMRENKIMRSWVCEPLLLTDIGNKLQIYLETLPDVEFLKGYIIDLNATIATQTEELGQVKQELTQTKQTLENAITALNTQAEEQKQLNERLKLLEQNYDPALI